MIVTNDFGVHFFGQAIPTVIGREPLLCPVCRHPLICYGYRLRRYYDESEIPKKIRIRRLFCPRCNRIHHELPGFVRPGRLYPSKS